ncbi:MAG TPA: cytochrome c3 family protein [Vicinamibacterales bacterium]|nr:cytochrome c3 family protein [Vicinamibacterales bacterium]
MKSAAALFLGIALVPSAAGAQTRTAPATPAYVGSQECRTCHTAIYDRWKNTRMANVVRDPREHPEAIIPDMSKPDPALTFTKDQIALVYGSKWKQRYFTKVGDDYVPLGSQWEIARKKWSRYHVPDTGADWWTAFYPSDNLKRPTGPTCDGCHSVNYDIRTKQPTEWNVGCEKCHGPGGDHVNNPSRANIVNPTRLSSIDGVNVCVQCHSQGQPLAKPLAGKYYDWPVGYRPGLRLSDFWQLEEHKLGETTFTHYADGTGHKNRMQGNDFVQSVMYTRGVTCFSCHDVHGTGNNADLVKPANVLCLDCHGPKSPNGPHTATIEQHTHHTAGSAGNECVNCHMPQIEPEIAGVNVRSHTFKFISPATTDALKVPNPCTTCHTDKTTKWALDALKSWPEFSPWRVANAN